jgi:uncharacterized coiled-coil DUF342 family protein
LSLADQKNAEIKKCFDQFQNYPTQRNACINRVNTSEKYKDLDQ